MDMLVRITWVATWRAPRVVLPTRTSIQDYVVGFDWTWNLLMTAVVPDLITTKVPIWLGYNVAVLAVLLLGVVVVALFWVGRV